MSRYRFSSVIVLAACCVAPAAVAWADGDEPTVGIARISDQPSVELQPPPAGFPGHHHAPGVAHGAAPVAGVPHGLHDGLVGGPWGSGLAPEPDVIYSPDYGWTRPVKRPVLNRVPVQYHRYWPYRWYGEPGAFTPPLFPMVYQPTDTTQLGFHYQRVPTWLPNPGMIPPPPWPATWHRREPAFRPPVDMYGMPLVGDPYGGVPVAAPVGGVPVGPAATSPPPSRPADPEPPPLPPAPRDLDRSASNWQPLPPTRY